MMRVGVIGCGRVGRAVEQLCLHYGHEVNAWDGMSGEPCPLEELGACLFAVVCVGTPAGEDGSADVSAVIDAVERLPTDRVLLKSTVPPGTTERVAELSGKDVCYWPEYVSESGYHNPHFAERIEAVPFVVLGGEPPVRRWSSIGCRRCSAPKEAGGN